MGIKEYTAQEIKEFLIEHGAKPSSVKALLHQYRSGQKKGKYKYPPLLIENEDWKWERGLIVYFESAVRKLELRD